MTAAPFARLERRARALLGAAPAGEFLRYFAASAAGLCVDFGLYVALTRHAGWHYLASAAAGFCAGLATVYALSVLWVFGQRRLRNGWHEFALFALIGLAGLALTELVLYACTGLVGLDYRVSKIFAAGLVFLFNFGCRKLLLFTHPRP